MTQSEHYGEGRRLFISTDIPDEVEFRISGAVTTVQRVYVGELAVCQIVRQLVTWLSDNSEKRTEMVLQDARALIGDAAKANEMMTTEQKNDLERRLRAEHQRLARELMGQDGGEAQS